jgi:hypothetical protein
VSVANGSEVNLILDTWVLIAIMGTLLSPALHTLF